MSKYFRSDRDRQAFRAGEAAREGATWKARALKAEQQRDEAIVRAEAAERERDMWKANHDNQVKIKRAIMQRPDLKERAALVQELIQQRDALLAALRPLLASYRAAELRASYNTASSAWFRQMPGHWPMALEATMEECRLAEEAIQAAEPPTANS